MGCGNCAKTIIHGAMGLTKAITGADAAPADEVQRRRDICRACPLATLNKARRDRPTKGLTSLSRCEVCGCFIAAKTKVASESCPLDKW